jgi:TonB family protein
LVTAPDVPYPDGASGDAAVVLELLIDENGDVADVKVEEGEEPFASRAKEGAKSFKFDPAKKDGKPIKARIRYKLSFKQPVVVAPYAFDGSGIRQHQRKQIAPRRALHVGFCLRKRRDGAQFQRQPAREREDDQDTDDQHDMKALHGCPLSDGIAFGDPDPDDARQEGEAAVAHGGVEEAHHVGEPKLSGQ